MSLLIISLDTPYSLLLINVFFTYTIHIYIYYIKFRLNRGPISTFLRYRNNKQKSRNRSRRSTGMLRGKRNFTKKRGYREELFTSNLA